MSCIARASGIKIDYGGATYAGPAGQPALKRCRLKKSFAAGVVIASLLLISTSASAQVLTYGANGPTGNYAAFLATIGGFGSGPTTIDFNSHPTGPLNPLFTPGVTFTAVGDVNTVASGSGPADGNSGSTPLSSGEGLHAASNYLFDGGSASSLTISFANQVSGAGLFIIDYFNPTGSNPLNFAAWTGANGTGTLLGAFSSVAYNFQNNNLYFMGITSAAGDIGSIVFTDVNSSTGDTTGIDDVTYAVNVQATPEPASIFLMATGLGALGFVRRRKRAA